MIEWKEDKIKEAARDFSKWQGKAVVMVDTSNGDVWTDTFTSGTDWREYHSETVFSLHSKDSLHGRNGRISEKAINELLKAEAYKYENIEEMPMEILKIFYQHKL